MYRNHSAQSLQLRRCWAYASVRLWRYANPTLTSPSTSSVSVDAATRTVGGVKSEASSADLPMSRELEARLRTHLLRREGNTNLLFVNRCGRPYSANKLREKQLHPLLDALKIPRGGFHSMRHGAASSPLADGATPAVVQRQLRHSDARITLGIYGHVVGDEQRIAVQNRSTRLAN